MSVASWTVLGAYLQAADWIGMPPSWPPAQRVAGTDFGAVAERVYWALRGMRLRDEQIHVAEILHEPQTWLLDSGQEINDWRCLTTATVYVRALAPVPYQREAQDLLSPSAIGATDTSTDTSTHASGTGRTRRGARRWLFRQRPATTPTPSPRGPLRLLDVAHWDESMWWRRIKVIGPEPIAMVHAAAGIAAAVWTTSGAVNDPVATRRLLAERLGRATGQANPI